MIIYKCNNIFFNKIKKIIQSIFLFDRTLNLAHSIIV